MNAELSGFDIMINSFGEIESTLSIDKINDFLGKNLPDKKLKEQEDKPDMKK